MNFAIVRGRVTVEHMEWERRAMSQRGFAVELLGAGDYPPTDASADVLVSVGGRGWRWRIPSSVLVDPVCLAFDVSPDRQDGDRGGRASNERGKLGMSRLIACGRRARAGWRTGCMELYAKHEVAEIVCDGYGPSAAIAPQGRRGGDHGAGGWTAQRVREGVRPVRGRGRRERRSGIWGRTS